MLLTIQRILNSIGMSMGLNKCAISTLDKGGASQRLWSVQGIPYLNRDVTYKYLGIKQHFGHGDSQCTKEAIEK